MNKLIICVILFLSQATLASTIAIIDSGTDMEHDLIKPQAWINPGEIADNNRDEDHNGYQDDIFGWNFPGKNNQVIDYSYLGTLNDNIRKFFAIQAKFFDGTVTQEEMDWMSEIRNNEDFRKRIGIYGNFMHGTHVAGISAMQSKASKILAVKLIPTEVKLPFSVFFNAADFTFAKTGWGDSAKKYLLKKALVFLADQNVAMLEEIAYYVGNHKSDVANGSFGTGYGQSRMIIANLFNLAFKRQPTEEEGHEFALVFLNALLKGGKKVMAAAPNTLFVFAAGNEGIDNDLYPTSPTNVKADNQISVAATMGRSQIAPFSNYGETMVEVAAPGVAIESSAPGNEYIKISGTSQAAPYVAGLAAKIKETNKALMPSEVKMILMETVDLKEFLKGKVKAAGIVNNDRAIQAAKLSLTMSLEEAISSARLSIQDIQEESFLPISGVEMNKFILPLPSMFR